MGRRVDELVMQGVSDGMECLQDRVKPLARIKAGGRFCDSPRDPHSGAASAGATGSIRHDSESAGVSHGDRWRGCRMEEVEKDLGSEVVEAVPPSTLGDDEVLASQT